MAQHTRRTLLAVLLLCLFAYASFVRASFVFAASTNGDALAPAIFLHGLARWGWGFPASWSYAGGYWLFTVDLVAALVRTVLGSGLAAMLILGWLFFAANACLAGLLARRLAGNGAFFWVTLLTLAAPLPALSQSGLWLSFSVTHNSTMTFALAALLAALIYLDGANPLALAAVFLLTLLADASDHWVQAAFVLPLLVALWRTARRGDAENRRRALVLGAALLAAVFAIKLKLFGLLSFLPPEKFAFGNLHTLAIQCQVSLRAALSALDMANALSLAAALLAFIAAALLLRAPEGIAAPAPRTDSAVILWFAPLSAALVLFSFLISRFGAGVDDGGRDLVNLFYLAPLIALAWWSRSGFRLPGISRAALAAYCVAGLFTTPGLLPPAQATFYPQARAVVAVLRANDLTYGYGSYFGPANVNALTLVSRGNITARQINLNVGIPGFSPSVGQGSAFWYTAREAAQAPANTFLLLGPSSSVDLAAAAAVAARQFGPPDKSQDLDDMRLLAWNHSLVPAMSQAHTAERKDWKAMNIARNQRAIAAVCAALHIPDTLPQRLYVWWLARH
ncbi:MAG TPA: hypothetical protein PLY97_04865 [Acidocella sp.]|nr:hypothetical protein [Acidocella sp.]